MCQKNVLDILVFLEIRLYFVLNVVNMYKTIVQLVIRLLWMRLFTHISILEL